MKLLYNYKGYYNLYIIWFYFGGCNIVINNVLNLLYEILSFSYIYT